MTQNFGQKIKLLRKEQGLTQQALADAVEVSKNYICQIETDRKMPSTRLMFKLGEVLGTTPDELLKDDATIKSLKKNISADQVRSMITELQELLVELEK